MAINTEENGFINRDKEVVNELTNNVVNNEEQVASLDTFNDVPKEQSVMSDVSIEMPPELSTEEKNVFEPVQVAQNIDTDAFSEALNSSPVPPVPSIVSANKTRSLKTLAGKAQSQKVRNQFIKDVKSIDVDQIEKDNIGSALEDDTFLGIKKYEFDNLSKILIDLPIQFTRLGQVGKSALRKAIKDTGEMAVHVMTAWNWLDQNKGKTGLAVKDGIVDSLRNIQEVFSTDMVSLYFGNTFKNYSEGKYKAHEKTLYLLDDDDNPLLDEDGNKIQVDATTFAKHEYKKLGLDKVLKYIADDVVGGVNINYDDLKFIEKTFFHTVEFATPLGIIPFMFGANIVRKSAKFLDQKWYAPTMLKQTYPNQTKEWYEQTAKRLRDGDKNFKDNTTTIEIKKGKDGEVDNYTYKHKHNLKKDVMGLRVFDGINRNFTAGLSVATTDEYMRNTMSKEDYQKYKPISYLFGMAGYLTGGKMIANAALKVPGALAPFTGIASLVPPMTLVPIVYGIGHLGAKAGGFKFEDTITGEFLRATAAGVSFPAVIKAYRADATANLKGEERTTNLTGLIERSKIKGKGLRLLQDSILNAPPEVRKEIIESGRAFAESMESALKSFSGVKGLENFHKNNIVIPNQLIRLAHTQGMLKIIIGSADFKSGMLAKSGLLKKLTGFNDKGEFGGLMDDYTKSIQTQQNFIGKQLEMLQKDFSENKSEKVGKIINVLSEKLNKLKKDSVDFKTFQERLKKEMNSAGGVFENNMIANIPRNSVDEGGFTVEKYNGNINTTPIIGQQSDEVLETINLEKTDLYDKDTVNFFKSTYDAMSKRASDMYPTSDEMQNFIPATSLINAFDRSLLASNEHVMRLSGLKNFPNTKQGFISFTRLNFLQAKNLHTKPDSLLAYIAKLQQNIEGSTIIGPKGEKLNTDYFDTLTVKVEEGNSAEVVESLSKFKGATEADNAILSTNMPPIMTISDAHNMRMNAWKQTNASFSSNTATGAQKFQSLEHSNTIDDLFKEVTEDSESVLQLLDVDPKIIKDIIAKRQTANENYRSEIGSVWKTHLGSKLHENNIRKAEAQGNPSGSVDRWLNFILDTRLDSNAKQMSITMFNKIAPKGTPERDQAIDMINHAFSVAMQRPNARNFIINDLDKEHIKRLVGEGILTKDQGGNLITLQNRLLQSKKGLKPPEIQKMERAMNVALNRLDSVKKEAIKNSFPEVVLGKGDINVSKLVETIFETDVGKFVGNSVSEISDDVKILKEQIDYLRNIQRVGGENTVTEAVKNANGELDEAFKNLNTYNFGDPMEALLDILGNSKENIKLLDDIEQMMFHHVFTDSTKLSQQATSVFSNTLPADIYAGQIEKLKDLFGKTGDKLKNTLSNGLNLQPEVSIDLVHENFAKMINPLTALLKKRSELGINAEASRIFLNYLQRMNDILITGSTLLGKVSSSRIDDMPKLMSQRQKFGRLYNWARGFVSPWYLGIEKMADNVNKTQTKVLQDILLDPKAGSVLLDIIENEGKLISPSKFDILGKAIWKATRGATGEKEYTRISKEKRLIMLLDSMKNLNLPVDSEDLLKVRKILSDKKQKRIAEERRKEISDSLQYPDESGFTINSNL